jgi:hypothetical protein
VQEDRTARAELLVVFGYQRAHVTEGDPVILLWSKLTGRTLAPRERTIFLRRNDTEALRGLLMLHGPDWMRTALPSYR